MNSFSSKPTKFLYFEVARLRTLYDSKPEIREAIIERYGQVVKELDGRGAKWFWAPHLMDQFIDIKKAFIKPNKPAWRIFTPEEVFDISGFELPVLVDIKIDGMRLQVHNNAGVQIYSEDEGLNKTQKFKEPLEDIKKLPEGTILDAEGVLVADGQVLHRTSFIGYVNGKGFDEEKDKQSEFWVFDVLRWGNKDLTDEPLSVRLSYLKKVPECKHLKMFKAGEEAFICETREEVLSAIKKVAGKKGSEGAMIKLLSSLYVKDVHNKGWIKLKNLKEVDCLVVEIEQPKHQKGPLEGKPVEGVFNYHVAAGPYPEEDGKILLDKVPTKVREHEGKVYAHLGKTFNTEIRVKVGDIIRVWSPEINKYEVKGTDLFTYGIYEPKVLEWVHERNIPDSLNVLDRLAEETSGLHPREAKLEKKEYPFVLDKHYGAGIHTHFDLRWRTTKTHKQEINVYHEPKTWKDKFTPARFKEFEESEASVEEWMITEGKHVERHVMGVDTPTYIDVLDSGTLEVRDHQKDRLVLDVKGKVLNGLYEFELTGSMEELTKEESNSMYLPRHSCMLIWSGVKTLIVKEKHFEGMLKKKMNLCDDNYKYGDIVLTRMFEMSREEVDRSRKRSRLTDLDMEDWKGARIFYGYDFEFEPLEEPQEVKVPHGAQTFFNIEKVEGDDWCSSQGGHWITVEGRHICIGDDKDLGNGLTERKLISPNHVTSLKFDVGRRQTVDEISSRYNSLSPELRSRINNIEITRGRETMAEHWARHGLDISKSDYKKYSESEVGGYFNEKTKTITLLAGGGLEVYYHESGHAFEPSWDKGGKEWFEVWTTEKVSGYAAVDRHEGFAEATEAYFVDSKGLKVESPKTSKFMEEYYGGS